MQMTRHFFSETEHALQMALNNLSWYCARWKLELNIRKAKIMVFRKGGRLRSNLIFTYDNQKLEIVTFHIFENKV